MELQPESDGQAAIVPTQLILHSIAAPWTPRRIYEYWRDSTNLESHFGLGYDGSLGQYIGTQTRADANMYANLRPDGTGAISCESASNLQHTDPWTDAQVEALIQLGVWAHQHPAHRIPLRICRTHDDPGFGVHRMFPQWSDGGTACPGDARVRQFHDVVFPGIVARASGTAAPTPSAPTPAPTPVQEDDMPYTLDQIAEAVWDHRLENGGRLDAQGRPWMQPAQDFQVDQDRKFALTLQALTAIQARQAAQDAVLATVLDGVHGLDGAAVIARLSAAVDAAVQASLKDGVTLQVAVTGTTTPKAG
jgi:hypothetical protein